jgi:hypothetical protein
LPAHTDAETRNTKRSSLATEPSVGLLSASCRIQEDCRCDCCWQQSAVSTATVSFFFRQVALLKPSAIMTAAAAVLSSNHTDIFNQQTGSVLTFRPIKPMQ